MQIRNPSAQDIANKTVLVRTDYNVPLEKFGPRMQVKEHQRILDSLPLIKFLQENNCRIILMSHLGRPGGEIKPELSLEPIARYLKKEHELPVKFVDQTVGEKVEAAVNTLQPKEILILENLRFQPEEKKNDSEFAKQLAQLADIYINEAFSASHRAHASIAGVPQYLPAFAGLHLQKEVKNLERLMSNPAHPFVMVIGGAKISDKVEAVQNLDEVADIVLVGGGVANNFLKAGGIETHKSYLEESNDGNDKKETNYVAVAEKLIEENKTERVLKDGYIPLPKILAPIDVVAAPNKDSTETEIISLTQGMADTPDDKDLMYLDIGPRTIQLFTDLILQAKTVFWNGPVGVFEKEPFEAGTREIARAIAKSGAETFIGGGDTITAAKKFGFADRYDYVSSAGGAALEFLAGKKLPGLEILKK
jgi:phosphoglycerate kinase